MKRTSSVRSLVRVRPLAPALALLLAAGCATPLRDNPEDELRHSVLQSARRELHASEIYPNQITTTREDRSNQLGIDPQRMPELNKMAEAGQLQIWNLAWITNIPDADSFYSPLYSRNVGTSNDARLKLREYDEAYERMRSLPEGPERRATYRRMNDLVAAYAPWILETYSYQNRLVQPWLEGVKLHPFRQAPWAYYDVAR